MQKTNIAKETVKMKNKVGELVSRNTIKLFYSK